MSNSYSTVFGGNLVAPAIPTYLALNISQSVELSYPVDSIAPGSLVIAEIIDVTATAANLTITLDDATLISNGYCALFNNIGANSVAILNSAGATIATVASGQAWQVYLADNSTSAGTWRVFQYGAGVSTANAASLAGAGLEAITTTLNAEISISPKTASYVASASDRASCIEWTGGSGGVFTLPAAAAVGSNWFCYIKNSGTGAITVQPPSGTINGAASQSFNPNDSAIVLCDGTNYFTVGFGQSVASSFNFVSISLAGVSGNYALAGAQLNRISYKFTGALAGNTTVVVPASIQQYWVDNETTGGTLTISPGGAGSTVAVPTGNRVILYCDGTNVINAITSGAVQFGDGTAGGPSITFSSDTTTGLYKAGVTTLGFSTAGVARGSIGATGTWSFATPSSGPTLSLGVLNNINYATETDGTETLYRIFDASHNLHLGVQGAHNLLLATNAADRVQIGSAGNVTINTPGSGTALALTAAGLSTGLNIFGTAANGINQPLLLLQNTGGSNGYSGLSLTCATAVQGTSDLILYQTAPLDAGNLINNGTGGLNLGNSGYPQLLISGGHNTSSQLEFYGPNAGAYVDMTPDSGFWTGVLTGNFSSNPSALFKWVRYGSLVVIKVDATADNTTTGSVYISISGLPAEIQPASQRSVTFMGVLNNSSQVGGLAVIGAGSTFQISPFPSAPFAAGYAGILAGTTIVYSL